MSEAIERLYRLVVDAAQATTQLKKIDAQLGKVNGTFAALGDLAKTTAATIGVGFGVNALQGLVESTAEIGRMADSVGLGVEAFQELQFAAERVGIDDFTDNARSLVEAMGELQQGTGPLVERLKGWNDELIKSLENTTTQEEAFYALADGVKNAGTATERAAIAAAAFGESGIVMVNVLKGGSEGLKEMATQAQSLGVIMREELVRDAQAYDTQLKELSLQAKATFGNAFLGAIRAVNDNAVKVWAALVASAQKAWAAIEFSVSKLWIAIKRTFNEGVEGVLTPLRKLLEFGGQYNDTIAEMAKTLPVLGDAEAQASQEILAAMQVYADKVQAADDVAVAVFQMRDADIAARDAAAQLQDTLKKNEAELAKAEALRKKQAEQDKKAAEELDKLAAATKAILDVADPTQAAIQAFADQVATLDKALKAGIITQEQYTKATEALKKGMEETKEETETLSGAMEDLLVGSIDDVANSFIEFASGAKKSFSDLTKSILTDIAKLLVKFAILQGLDAAFPGLNLLGGTQPTPTSAPLALGVGTNAAAFAAPVQARNTVTAAPLLATNATGASVAAVNVNVKNYTTTTDVTTQRNSGGDIEILITEISDRIRRGGNAVSRAFEGTYGVSRAKGAF